MGFLIPLLSSRLCGTRRQGSLSFLTLEFLNSYQHCDLFLLLGSHVWLARPARPSLGANSGSIKRLAKPDKRQTDLEPLPTTPPPHTEDPIIEHPNLHNNEIPLYNKDTIRVCHLFPSKRASTRFRIHGSPPVGYWDLRRALCYLYRSHKVAVSRP